METIKMNAACLTQLGDEQAKGFFTCVQCKEMKEGDKQYRQYCVGCADTVRKKVVDEKKKKYGIANKYLSVSPLHT